MSASRRTDIPAFYLDRLIEWINRGYVDVPNPYSGKRYRVGLRPDEVHTLVLWSKNFGPFLAKAGMFKSYRLYFLFTINDMPRFEPGVPPLDTRLMQIEQLAKTYGPERMAWRFDPVIFGAGGPITGIDAFSRIGERIAAAGITRVIFSFLSLYGKVRRRNESRGLGIVDPPCEVKREYASELAGAAAGMGLDLESCCGDIGDVDGVRQSSCINGRLLGGLAGEPADTSPDRGQRNNCHCTVSRDIGSYADMPCPAGCVYCYANPILKTAKELPC